MKALVTGASGFVGSHLVEHLLEQGVAVRALVRASSDLKWLNTDRIEVCSAGMDDPAALADAAADVDYVFHVAGLTRGRTWAEYEAVNVEATRRLVEAVAGSRPDLKRFVLVSSLAAVGPNLSEAPQDEQTPPHPHDHYGRSKLAGEQAVRAAAGRIPIAIVRPPGVYGPRDTNLLPMFRAARRRGLAPVIGRLSKQVSLVHVADLARGAWLAAATPAAVGQTYFLASGTHTMAEIVDALAAAVSRRLRVLRVPSLIARLAGEFGQLKWAVTGRSQIVSRRKIHDLLQPRWTCTWQKADDELGYRPAFELADGFRRTDAWYVDQGWV